MLWASKARSEEAQLVCLGLRDARSQKPELLCVKPNYPENSMQNRPPVGTPVARPREPTSRQPSPSVRGEIEEAVLEADLQLPADSAYSHSSQPSEGQLYVPYTMIVFSHYLWGMCPLHFNLHLWNPFVFLILFWVLSLFRSFFSQLPPLWVFLSLLKSNCIWAILS